MKAEDFAGRGPAMVLEEFFAGRTRAWGILQDRFGALREQFAVDIVGTWDPDVRTLRLREDFTYSDGHFERRVWTIEKIDENHYRGRADDVVGLAGVKAYGNVANLTYRMRLRIARRDWTLDFDDWMFRQDHEVVINRATVTKWGIEIGSATIFFRKLMETCDASCQPTSPDAPRTVPG